MPAGAAGWSGFSSSIGREEWRDSAGFLSTARSDPVSSATETPPSSRLRRRRRFGCSLADDGTLFMQVGAETYALSLYRLGTHWNWFPRRIFDAQCGSVCHGLQGAKGDALVDAWIRPLRQRVAEEAMLDTADRPMLHLTPEQVRVRARRDD